MLIHVLLSVLLSLLLLSATTNKAHVHYSLLPLTELFPSLRCECLCFTLMQEEVQKYLPVGVEVMHIDSPTGGDGVWAETERDQFFLLQLCIWTNREKKKEGRGEKINLSAINQSFSGSDQ